MKTNTPNIETTVPAGTYFLGDPCYAVQDEKWMPWLEDCGYLESPDLLDGEALKGQRVVAVSTAYGDGTYYDGRGNRYSVDAGIIGLTPLNGFKPRYDVNRLKELGAIIELHQDAVFNSTDDGVIEVRMSQKPLESWTIETDDFDEYDEYDEYDY